MRQDIREFSGWGELLCLVMAWTVGMAALWSDYAGRAENESSNKVAVSGAERESSDYFD
jgi:hypothetical protein